MTWLVDPDTREPLPAFEAYDRRIRRLGGPVEWPGEHVPGQPGWELSTVDEIGFQYARQCRRPCCHPPAPDADR